MFTVDLTSLQTLYLGEKALYGSEDASCSLRLCS